MLSNKLAVIVVIDPVMHAENSGPHTPFGSGKAPPKNNNTFTKIESVSDLQDESPSSGNKVLELGYQQILFANSPRPAQPATVQKHWWTPQEDEKLKQLVEEYGAKNWKKIASFLEERTDVQCLHRWQKVLNPALVKGPWVPPYLYRLWNKIS